jgi:hypothetical protein
MRIAAVVEEISVVAHIHTPHAAPSFLEYAFSEISTFLSELLGLSGRGLSVLMQLDG